MQKQLKVRPVRGVEAAALDRMGLGWKYELEKTDGRGRPSPRKTFPN